LGIQDAFSGGLADFSGISGSVPPLFVSDVIQDAFIDVNEERTEAAAVEIVVVKEALPSEPVEPVVMRIDRPFIYMIRERETGTILFIGRVLNPEQS